MGATKNMAVGAAAGSAGGLWGAAIGAGAGLLVKNVKLFSPIINPKRMVPLIFL